MVKRYVSPKDEILQMVRKFVQVPDDAVTIQVERDGTCEVLELNVTLPEQTA